MGPDQGLGPDGKDSGPFVDGGLLAKERQEKRFASAGIVIREKRRVPVLPECPQYGKSRFPVPDDVRPMRRAQPRGDVIHQLVFIRPHDRQARMVGYIPKQAGQQFPSPEMCRCYHTGALSSFETLQQIRALHVEQGMGQAELGNEDRLEERTGVVREAGRASDSAVACESSRCRAMLSVARRRRLGRHVQSREPSPLASERIREKPSLPSRRAKP